MLVPFQVLDLRITYEQIVWALCAEERERLGFAEKMSDFLTKALPASTGESGKSDCVFTQLVCNPLAYNPYSGDQWYAAVNFFNEKIAVAEEMVVPHLRTVLSSIAQKSKNLYTPMSYTIQKSMSLGFLPYY